MSVLGRRVPNTRQTWWRSPGLVVLLALLTGAPTLWGQSLAEVAQKEKERRKTLEGEEKPLSSAPSESEPVNGPVEKASGIEQGESPSPLSAEPSEEPAAKETEASNDKTLGKPSTPVAMSTAAKPQPGFHTTQQPRTRSSYDLRGALYIDWFRFGYGDDDSTSQLSARFKLQWGHRPGNGWRIRIDLRDRWTQGDSENQLRIYDAAFILDDQRNPWTLSLGQMNLYDSAGIGQLLGGLFGYRADESWTVGGYGGLQPQIFTNSLDTSYQKYGVFARYNGDNAQSASVSYNSIRFAGNTERQFLYLTGLAPLYRVVVYGNMEFELGPSVVQADRLSRLVVTARFDVTDTIDIRGNYSSGKGLDYHRFLLEKSKDPRLSDAELERF